MSEFIYTQEDFDALKKRHTLEIADLNAVIGGLEFEVKELISENREMYDQISELDYQINEW